MRLNSSRISKAGTQVLDAGQNSSFLARHEFLIRRLHSLTGLVPVGAYMVVHLLVNASVLDGPGTFQRLVYQIHSLGVVLWVVEWALIFLPLIFHAVLGVVIIRGGLSNSGTYAHASNIRYTLQRASGMIALLFIAWHVFHMHGWFHAQWWREGVVEPLGGARFNPYNAASSAADALQGSVVVMILYVVGVLACVFHLANGLWAMGITWGVWTTPAAQRRASGVCAAGGVILAAVGLSSLAGMGTLDIDQAKQIEKRMEQAARVTSGEVTPDEHKQLEVKDKSQGE